LAQSQPPITRTTHALPFDELSPRDFERLGLWLVEREGYQRAGHPTVLSTCASAAIHPIRRSGGLGEESRADRS
jgi:hypothetical protein